MYYYARALGAPYEIEAEKEDNDYALEPGDFAIDRGMRSARLGEGQRTDGIGRERRRRNARIKDGAGSTRSKQTAGRGRWRQQQHATHTQSSRARQAASDGSIPHSTYRRRCTKRRRSINQLP